VVLRRRQRRVLTDVARVFSTVCNPFVTALVLFVVISHRSSRSIPEFWTLLAISTLFTSIGPMLYVFYLYANDKISDLDMSVRAERQRVFSGFVISYTSGTLALLLVHAPPIMTATMGGYAAASIVTQAITRSWKISTHALGITAPIVVMLYLYGREPLPFVVLVPIVGWSRVYLKAHTLRQVLAGTGLGLGSTLLMFRVFHLV